MPNVPNVPGVPPLTSYGAQPVVLLAADLVRLISGLFAPQWGVFLDGAPAFEFNSTVSFDYRQDWPISDYPIEDGAFQSYDKVQLPFDVRVRMASAGTTLERQAMLDGVDAAANTLDLYDVVTPERVFSGCNITHYDYKRSADSGVGMITFDIWFQQIRVTSTASFVNTKSPVSAGQQGLGAQQPSSFDEAGFLSEVR